MEAVSRKGIQELIPLNVIMAYMKSISMYSIMLQNPLLTYTNKIGPGPRFSVVSGAKVRHQLSY